MSDSKRQRILKIIKIVNSLGRAQPQDVVSRYVVASQIEEKKIKRTIYRDLKELADGAEIDVQYFLPNGTEISVDDLEKFKNIRIYYSTKGVEAKVIGSGLIESIGGRIYLPPQSLSSWRVSESYALKEMLWLTLITPFSKLLHLGHQREGLPTTMLISRNEEIELKSLELSRIQERFGYRSAIFFCWDKFISRMGHGERLCHCALRFHRDQRMEIIDDGSTSGTFYCLATEASIADFLRPRGAETDSLERILAKDKNFVEVTKSKVVSLPCFVRVGHVSFLVHLS
ncbi:MAG: FHA domain-containing protein [Bdellovibrionales bacterium]|nr:FHA domain-containing protein [Bdellovibrionales bacterium]